MKKFVFSILLLTTVAIANAQAPLEFKPFKVDVSLGYAIPGGTGAKGGVLFVVEPKYAVLPNVSLGLRMEAAVMARGTVDAAGNAANVDVKAAGSYLLTGDYYFTQTVVRPFAGAGLGIYSLASASANTNGTTSASASASSKFGEMVRAGVEISHFRVGLEYNIVPKTTVDAVDGSGNKTTYTTKNGYVGIKLGFCIGGGRIK